MADNNRLEEVSLAPILDNRPKGLVRALMAKLTGFLVKEPSSPIVRDLKVTTETGASDANYASFTDALWRVRHDRKSIYNDLHDMDLNDPLVATALDVIADCATGYEDVDIDAFDWILESNDDKARKLLDELKGRLDLGSEAWQITRNFVRNGEEFREVVVDDDDIIQRFKYLPPYQIMPKFDRFGNKIPGWEQRPETTVPGLVIDFEEWQIVAFVYGARRGWFGSGLLLPARRTWRRLQKVEDGMAIARMTRAYDKLLHKVPVKADWDTVRVQETLLNYRNNMTKRRGLDSDGNVVQREKPLEIETDFYIPDDGSGKGGIDVLAAQNMQLMNIEDVQHHQDLLLARLKVPRKYMNLSSKKGALTEGGLAAEDIQFARTLRQVQAVLRAGLRQLGAMALIFQGYDPDRVGLGIRLPKISTEDQLTNAKIQFTFAQAAKLYAEVLGGLPQELVADKYMELDDDTKEILATFVTDQESKMNEEKSRQRELEDRNFEIDKKIATKRTETGSSSGTNKPSQSQVAQAITELHMLCQAELEAAGVEFQVGHAERLDKVHQVMTEMLDLGEGERLS